MDKPPADPANLRERLARTGQRSAMAETAAAIAHEVGQPLTAIAMYAQTARDLADQPPSQSGKMIDALDKVIEQAVRAGNVLERVRQLVYGEEGRFEPADVNALVADVVEVASLDAQAHGIAIELLEADDLPPLQCDAVQIQQVILNLIRNAVDAMADPDRRHGDTITVAIQADDATHVRIDVVDGGTGVASDIDDGLFAVRQGGRPPGLGIGLAICRTIVLNHHGRLDWRNNNAETGGDDTNRGATFSVTLPVEHPDDPA